MAEVEDRPIYRATLRLLARHFKDVELDNTISGEWVRQADNACCPILKPMSGMLAYMRSRSGRKPKNPGEYPPVTLEMIRTALRNKGISWRVAVAFAAEYDAARHFKVGRNKAIIAGIRAAALFEDEHRGSADQVPRVAECMSCEFVWPLVDGQLVEHINLWSQTGCAGRARQHGWTPDDMFAGSPMSGFDREDL